MSISKIPSRIIFVGNIPYDVSEEQIIQIFSSAGKVLKFRLVHDRETGRPKGFGFAEYPDSDSAASAVRNLNNYEVKGRRLRVDFSNEGVDELDGELGSVFSDSYQPPVPSATAPAVPSVSLPPLPPGKELPPGVSCTDAISRTLNTLPPSQLLDVLSQLKTLATNDPARATELLLQAPQLSFAIFQALINMNLVSPEALQNLLESSVAVPVPPQQPQYAPHPAPPQQPPPQTAPPPYVASQQPQQQQQQQQPFAAVPPPPPAAAAAAPPQDTEALMKAVMELPIETINALPEAERAQILELRAAFGL